MLLCHKKVGEFTMADEKIINKVVRGSSNLTPQRQLKFQNHIVEHCNWNCEQ